MYEFISFAERIWVTKQLMGRIDIEKY